MVLTKYIDFLNNITLTISVIFIKGFILVDLSVLPNNTAQPYSYYGYNNKAETESVSALALLSTTSN